MIQIQKSMREAKQAMLRTFMETTIARVAKAVFAERGYQQATLEEIAQRAGMSKATIYLYYKNKDDLFLHVVRIWWKRPLLRPRRPPRRLGRRWRNWRAWCAARWPFTSAN